MEQKELLINSVSMVTVHDSTNIPTVLFYPPKGDVLIGSEALVASRGNRRHLNADFKIDLGRVDPKAPKEKFPTASGKMKSANVLTFDFLSRVISFVNEWLEANNVEKAPYVLLAEPLALEGDLAPPAWLSNYRGSLVRILFGKFDTIDFLPEPFAVFQYYRYGQKHPIVSERGKQYALVIDFGGGTFDVCIIETTKEGDISRTGRNSRPLAASSVPVGGFFLNKMIAEELFRSNLGKETKSKVNKGLDSYKRWRDDLQDIATLAPEYRNFINNFHEAIYSIEEPKVNLCRSISNWKLDQPINTSIRLQIPEDPFSTTSQLKTVHFSGADLRTIFINKIWEQRLRPVIKNTIQRGREELKGASITVVLLSGGSANLGWLKELLQRDFDVLNDVEILHLHDYQEVVAKGLAIECARRFHMQEGDFSSVTYNRLCLVLNSDNTGDEVKTFTPKTHGVPDVKQPAVLLPSASVLHRFLEIPITWQVKLDRPPHQRLDYYFLKSNLNPDITEDLQNVKDHAVYTPRNCRFDPSMLVQLTISQDGTARPKFIYRRGRTEEESVAVEGGTFALDMTCIQPETTPCTAFIGLDFGTSNSAVSYVDQTSMSTFRHRSADKYWINLNDLSASLPYPLAESLCSYIVQTDQSKLVRQGFLFLEDALTLAAYITYLDYCKGKGRAETKLFKNLTQRSGGPLWAFFQDCSKLLKEKATFSSKYRELLSSEYFGIINDAVNKLASYKHDKINEIKIDILTPVRIIANISQRVFSDYVFGFFEQVKKRKFGKEHSGRFRHAHGRPPFTNVSEYTGFQDFSEDELYILDSTEGVALSFTPLMFRDSCITHPDVEAGHLYLFDKAEKEHGKFSFKAVGFSCACEVSLVNEYSPLAEQLCKWKDMDPKIEPLELGRDSIKDIPET